MSALAIVINLLVANGDVAGATGGRIYPLVAPQGKPLPFVTVSVVAEEDSQMLEGAGRFYDALVSVAGHAASAADADELAEAIKTAIEDVTNEVVDEKTATVLKAGADVMDHSDDRSIYRRTVDYRVRWQ